MSNEEKQTPEEILQDAIGALDDHLKSARDLVEALETAETVENMDDFMVNLDEAIEYARQLHKELRDLKKETKEKSE